MMRLECLVEIKREWEDEGVVSGSVWTMRHVESVEITGDGETLGDTCVVKLPRKAKWGNYGEEVPIRRGDQVRVYLGYNGVMELRFIGYVRDVSAKTPIVITCEDEMFTLRRKSAKRKVYNNCTLKELLDDQLEGMNIARYKDANNSEQKVVLGDVRIEATTVAGVLNELKENFGITSYFAIVNEAPVLFSFAIFPDLRRNAGVFKEGKNIIENSLEYRRSDDVQIKIRGISIQEDNSRIEYAEGEGSERIIYRYNLSMEELKVAVKNELKREKWNGLSGDFTTFGKPRVEKMDVVDIECSGAKGRYQVKGVNISFGSNGYRQKIELKRRVTE